MTVELPPQYSWGFVVGRVIHAIADTTDDEDRFPEARGANGTVTFTPSTRLRRHTEPPASFILKESVTAEIVNGVLVDAEQQQGIYLISGPYRVEFSIRGGSIPSFAIEVTEEHTLTNPLDLVTAAPYVPSPGTPVTTLVVPAGMADDEVLAWRDGGLVWVPGAAQAEAAADRAETAEGLSRTYAQNASTSAQTASEAQGQAQAAQTAAEAARDAALATMPHIIVGAGRPDITGTLDPDVATRVTNAPSGTVFRSTDGPQGAWEWAKQGAAWVVTQGDTGWVNRPIPIPWGAIASGELRIRRTGAEVRAELIVDEWQSGSFGLQSPDPGSPPNGFRQTEQRHRPRLNLASLANPSDYVESVFYLGRFLAFTRRQGSSQLPTSAVWYGLSEPWHTADPWPTTLTI